MDPLLDLRVGAALLGRVQRQQLGEGLAHHGLVGVWEKRQFYEVFLNESIN